MLFEKKSPLAWDTISTVCIVNIHMALAFYLSSAVLTDQALMSNTPSSKQISLAYSSLIFTSGFLSRPLGALLFGIRTDLMGYAKSIRESVPMLLIATTLIGVLPASTLGVYALAILRIFQGIGFGGAYATIVTYLYRNAPSHCRGRVTSFLQASVSLGFVMVLLLLLLYKNSISANILPGESWRFLFSIPLLWLLLFRSLMSKDPSEKKTEITRLKLANYLKKGLRQAQRSWKRLLPDLILIIGIGALSFASANFKFYFMRAVLKIPPVAADLSAVITVVISLPFYFAGGYLADKFNLFKTNVVIGIIACISMPLCFRYIQRVIGQSPSLGNELDASTVIQVIGGLLIFSCLMSISFGGFAKYICDLFPGRHRCLMFGLTYSISIAVVGGGINLYETNSYLIAGGQYTNMNMTAEVASVAIFLSLVARFIFRRKAVKATEPSEVSRI